MGNPPGVGPTISLASLAVDAPVVVAVVVHGALPVEQQAVLAGLQGEGSVGALVELVAADGVMVQLQAIVLGAGRDLGVHHGGSLGQLFTGTCKEGEGPVEGFVEQAAEMVFFPGGGAGEGRRRGAQ